MRVILCLMAMMMVSGTAYAADPKLPPALSEFQQSGATFKYLGRTHGYDGWIGVRENREEYFYVAPDGSHFFMGVLFDKGGHAITGDQLKKIQGAPATDKPKETSGGGDLADQMYADMAAATAVSVGAPTAPAFYIVMDPGDDKAKETLNAFVPVIQMGGVQLRLILAPIPENTPEVAQVLGAKDPADALVKLMMNDKIKADPAVKPDTAAVKQNQELVAKWQFKPGPVTIYKAKNGTVRMVEGVVTDPSILLKDLL